jgi:hypothetical protein
VLVSSVKVPASKLVAALPDVLLNNAKNLVVGAVYDVAVSVI